MYVFHSRYGFPLLDGTCCVPGVPCTHLSAPMNLKYDLILVNVLSAHTQPCATCFGGMDDPISLQWACISSSGSL